MSAKDGGPAFRKPRGRPTKLTPEVQEQICQAVRAGNYLDIAASLVGINRRTLHDWLRRGARAKSGIYRDFSHAVEKALAQAEARDVLRIDKAGEKNWQAIAWKLERRFPKRWGRRRDSDLAA